MRLKENYKGNLITVSGKPVRDRQLTKRELQPDCSVGYMLSSAYCFVLEETDVL